MVRKSGQQRLLACATVERDVNHTGCPVDFIPIERFCNRHCFVRLPELRTSFAWREVGAESVTPHPMVFWIKEL